MTRSSKPRLTRALAALVGAVAIGTGTIGFASTDPRLLQHRWTIADEPCEEPS